MSFLYRTQPALRTLARPSSRFFTTTAIQNKSATEAVKDTVKSVDQTVSGAAVSGIEKGRKEHPASAFLQSDSCIKVHHATFITLLEQIFNSHTYLPRSSFYSCLLCPLIT